MFDGAAVEYNAVEHGSRDCQMNEQARTSGEVIPNRAINKRRTKLLTKLMYHEKRKLYGMIMICINLFNHTVL